MRRQPVLASVVAACTVLATVLAAGSSGAVDAAEGQGSARAATTGDSATAAEYVVLYKANQNTTEAAAAIARAGGHVVKQNSKIGYAVVTSTNSAFAADLDKSGVVAGAARNRVIGKAPAQSRVQGRDLERLTAEREASKGQASARAVRGTGAASEPEPLANLQWDMRQIGATPNGSYAKDQGSHRVLVGIIDTGIDGSHPDIAPNFNSSLSRNFTVDNPDIDGPCEHPSCVDPADEDDDGHGTHVASNVGSPINGLGIAGVAPKVSLVNIRAGQDSGFFFLAPTLEALVYAGDVGVDVVNMSFFTDPWLFNCVNNPADSPAEQAEQRVIRTATQRALNYAIHRGVLPVSAEGNEATDLGHPTVDDTSPDFPLGAAKHRDVDNSCITVPSESRGVLVVSSTGFSTRKAYYSNYGTEQTDVAAPGGDLYDTPGNTPDTSALVLGAYPQALAELNGDLNPDGTPNNPFVVQDCQGGTCAYYQYLQGTSMASPHAAGVAALIVSHFGRRDTRHGGVGLAPDKTRAIIKATAVAHACPQPRLFEYTRIRADGTLGQEEALCAGPSQDNGFYGDGIINAYAAVTGHH